MESGTDSLIEAPFFIDATPYGDLLELAGVEHVLGAESRSETGEPHAAERADPRDQQAITVCFAIEHLAGEDHTIEKPPQYELWRDFKPPGWPGPLLELDHRAARDARAADASSVRSRGRSPVVAFPSNPRSHELRAGFARSDITVVNWPQNDYWFGPVVGVDAGRARAPSRGGETAQLEPALLAADRGAAS